MQRYSIFGNKRSFSDESAWFLGKICLNYARNGGFVLPFREKVVSLQTERDNIMLQYRKCDYKCFYKL